MSESTLVTSCIWLLERHGIRAWRQQAGNLKLGRAWIRLGFKGMSDIGGILNDGRYLAVECKRPGNRPTLEQRAFLTEVEGRGGVALVIYSADQLERDLRARGW